MLFIRTIKMAGTSGSEARPFDENLIKFDLISKHKNGGTKSV